MTADPTNDRDANSAARCMDCKAPILRGRLLCDGCVAAEQARFKAAVDAARWGRA